MSNPFSKVTHAPTLRANLERASLFLAAYETLKSAIQDRVMGFYSTDWVVDTNGNLKGIRTPEYKTKVKALYPKDSLTACCIWLKNSGCFSEDQVQLVKRLRLHRDAIAHEIVLFVTRENKEVQRELILELSSLVRHLDIWWLREIELPISGDWTPEDVERIRWDEVTGGYSFLLDLILPIFDNQTCHLDELHTNLSGSDS